ncbi:uL30 family ribosomal protein [Candidatus Micrarchaeota archaeon]|nr:uL30 family ribosomal protein [Candidatus Micrarchaeota archaeon]
MDTLAIIRVRGIRSVKPRIKKTLELLRLYKPNHCVLLPATKAVLGMLIVAKDYVSYGPVKEDTVYKLLHKRGELGNKLLRVIKKDEEIKSIVKELVSEKRARDLVDPVFRLHPPEGGYKDIKSPYPRGDLGKRDNMDLFLLRMI